MKLINDQVSLRVNSNNKGVVVICGLIVENMYIKPTEFTEETLEVLSLFDDEIQLFYALMFGYNKNSLRHIHIQNLNIEATQHKMLKR